MIQTRDLQLISKFIAVEAVEGAYYETINVRYTLVQSTICLAKLHFQPEFILIFMPRLRPGDLEKDLEGS